MALTVLSSVQMVEDIITLVVLRVSFGICYASQSDCGLNMPAVKASVVANAPIAKLPTSPPSHTHAYAVVYVLLQCPCSPYPAWITLLLILVSMVRICGRRLLWIIRGQALCHSRLFKSGL